MHNWDRLVLQVVSLSNSAFPFCLASVFSALLSWAWAIFVFLWFVIKP